MMRWVCLVLILSLGFAFLSHADSNAQTLGRPHVYLTHLKVWLASGGFDQGPDSRYKQNSGRPDYTKEFQRQCARVILTDLEHADYAVAIDDKKLLSGFTNAKAAKFQYEIYSRSLGPIFAGGEDLLTKAMQKSCDAVTSPNPIPLGSRPASFQVP